MPTTQRSSSPVLPGLLPDASKTGVRAQPWRGYRGSKAMPTPSSRERAAGDTGSAVNNFSFGRKLCSRRADGQRFASGQCPETHGYVLSSGLCLSEPGGRGELAKARSLIFRAYRMWLPGFCTHIPIIWKPTYNQLRPREAQTGALEGPR